jgi:hypothetical protein
MCESNNKVMYERENVTLKNNTKENTHISYYLIHIHIYVRVSESTYDVTLTVMRHSAMLRPRKKNLVCRFAVFFT